MKYSRAIYNFILNCFENKVLSTNHVVYIEHCKMAVAEKSSSADDNARPHQHYKCGIILNVTGLIILVLIVGAILVLVYITTRHHVESLGYKFDRERQSVYRLVTRNEWIAQPPSKPLRKLKLPVDRVIIAATQTDGCTNRGECVHRVRMIQQYHIETRHFDDIAYNFLVGGDGTVYEGRGWYYLGAHTKGYNSGSIGIALIGQFKTYSPPMRQIDELKLLLSEGVRLGIISKDYKLYAHSAFAYTNSPGEQVRREIKNWSHYVNKLFIDTI